MKNFICKLLCISILFTHNVSFANANDTSFTNFVKQIETLLQQAPENTQLSMLSPDINRIAKENQIDLNSLTSSDLNRLLAENQIISSIDSKRLLRKSQALDHPSELKVQEVFGEAVDGTSVAAYAHVTFFLMALMASFALYIMIDHQNSLEDKALDAK